MERYCDLVKKELKNKIDFKNKILEELEIAKTEKDFPKKKYFEIKILFTDSQIILINNIIKEMEMNCPKDNWHEDSCKDVCESYNTIIKSLVKLK